MSIQETPKYILSLAESHSEIYGIDGVLAREVLRLRAILAAAQKFIAASLCDPDITKEQAEAWIEYQDIIKESAR